MQIKLSITTHVTWDNKKDSISYVVTNIHKKTAKCFLFLNLMWNCYFGIFNAVFLFYSIFFIVSNTADENLFVNFTLLTCGMTIFKLTITITTDMHEARILWSIAFFKPPEIWPSVCRILFLVNTTPKFLKGSLPNLVNVVTVNRRCA